VNTELRLSPRDILSLEYDVAKAVVREIQVRLTPQRWRVSRTPLIALTPTPEPLRLPANFDYNFRLILEICSLASCEKPKKRERVSKSYLAASSSPRLFGTAFLGLNFEWETHSENACGSSTPPANETEIM
jgi:hypothetical protein